MLFIHTLHDIIRRNLNEVRRFFTATLLAALLHVLMRSLPAFPAYWDVVIVVGVFIAALGWAPIAIGLAGAAAVYALYTLSLYLAVLFLCVLILGYRLFIRDLTATVMLFSAVWFVYFSAAWSLPLLMGLWFGRRNGFFLGMSAALWGLLLFGMSGLSPDFLVLLGFLPEMQAVSARFAGAGSLAALQLLVSPLVANPTVFLYTLLQIALWGGLAALAGDLSERGWFQRRLRWLVLLAVFAPLMLVSLHSALALWLERISLTDLQNLWQSSLPLSLLVSAALPITLSALQDFFEHPLPSGALSRRKPPLVSATPPTPTGAGLPASPESPKVANSSQKDEKDGGENDLIMLELD